MNGAKVVPIRLSAAERRERVAKGIEIGQSNRALAKELRVDEKTIRLDREALTMTVEATLPLLSFEISDVAPQTTEFGPEEIRERRVGSLLKVAEQWIIQEHLILPDIEYLVDRAGKLLYKDHLLLQNIPVSLRSAFELLAWSRPEKIEDDVTGLERFAVWLARWLALCLPREEELQDEVRHRISIWARRRYQDHSGTVATRQPQNHDGGVSTSCNRGEEGLAKPGFRGDVRRGSASAPSEAA